MIRPAPAEVPANSPLLRSLASVLASYDGAAELERGLDILLTGLTTTLTPQACRPGTQPTPQHGRNDLARSPCGSLWLPFQLGQVRA